MAKLSIQHWGKTPEGMELVESQKIFCIGGALWQGWKQVPIPVSEFQLSDVEMDDITDIDASMDRVWLGRRQRLEGRHSRKSAEYDKRRHELRVERSQIITSIKEARDLDMAPSPDDMDQIERINERMQGLVDLASQERLAKASIRVDPSSAPEVLPGTCEECGATQPADSKADPVKWLRGHKMGSHKKAV